MGKSHTFMSINDGKIYYRTKHNSMKKRLEQTIVSESEANKYYHLRGSCLFHEYITPSYTWKGGSHPLEKNIRSSWR